MENFDEEDFCSGQEFLSKLKDSKASMEDLIKLFDPLLDAHEDINKKIRGLTFLQRDEMRMTISMMKKQSLVSTEIPSISGDKENRFDSEWDVAFLEKLETALSEAERMPTRETLLLFDTLSASNGNESKFRQPTVLPPKRNPKPRVTETLSDGLLIQAVDVSLPVCIENSARSINVDDLLSNTEKEPEQELYSRLKEERRRVMEKNAVQRQRLQNSAVITRLQEENTTLRNTILPLAERSFLDSLNMVEDALLQKKSEYSDLLEERDSLLKQVRSTRQALLDAHERTMATETLLQQKLAQLAKLNQRVEDASTVVNKYEEKYYSFMSVAQKKIGRSEEWVSQEKRKYENSIVRLTTEIKRKDVQVSSLQTTIENKLRENHELVTMCDEIIEKSNPQTGIYQN